MSTLRSPRVLEARGKLEMSSENSQWWGECFNLPRLHCIYEQSKPEWINPPSSCTCWALVMRYSYWCSIQHEPRDILNRVNLLSQVLNRFLKSNIWSNMQILSHTELQAITYWTSSWTFEKMTWAYTVRSVLLKIVLCMMGVLVQGWHSANGNSCRAPRSCAPFAFHDATRHKEVERSAAILPTASVAPTETLLI